MNGISPSRHWRRTTGWVGVLAVMAAGAANVAGQDRLFPPDAVVNVSLAPYHARPDDGIDDTAAIQRAISENVDHGRTLYFPAGTYDVSDTLICKNDDGIWRAHITFQGQARDKTILRLRDDTEGFGDPRNPRPVLVTASHWNEGDGNDGGGNKAFRNNVFDLTIDTGTHNPGAIAIAWAVSNVGSIRNVNIRSGDGQGIAGISMRRKIPGPGYIKHVAIDGFDVGIDIADIQYGVTLEHVTLTNQRVAGVRCDRNLVHARRIKSVNTVPAIVMTHPGGALTILDSRFTGGSGDRYAIDCAGTALIRNVTTRGYRASAIRCRGQAFSGPDYLEVVHPGALGGGVARADGSALLPIRESPVFWNADLSDWQPVGRRRAGEPDDTAAIQRAIDSGKSTIYFPNDRVYFLSDTLVIRGSVKQVLGMGAEISLGAAREPFGDVENPRALIRIDPTDHDTVFFENMFFNAQYPGEVVFENNSPATVVIRHCAGWIGGGAHRRSYRNTRQGTGELYVEDVFLPGWEFNGQTVWARQFNPENQHGEGVVPQVSNNGGKLWILGFKTEGQAPFISTTRGGVTELLGGYNYISATHPPTVPTDAVPYIIEDSIANLTFVTENFRDNDYRVYIRNTQNGKTRDWKPSNLPPRDGHHDGDRSRAVSLFEASSD